jgi:hypothetical protein
MRQASPDFFCAAPMQWRARAFFSSTTRARVTLLELFCQ